jgi:sucrose-6-phosphate hydrolase SacC (GH32 family)
MKKQSLLLASAFLLAASASAQADNLSATTRSAPFPLYDEPYWPQYHFSPPMHFMNDPNGLFL